MGLFKKKIKKKKQNKNTFTDTPNLDLAEIPREAMNIIYEHKMAEYERCNSDREAYMNSERADTLQKQLAIMSKYMRNDSMKETIEYFKDKGFEDKIKDADPEKLRRMKQKMQDLDRAVENLYKEEPKEENNNITINMENTRKTVEQIKENIKQNDEDIDSAEKDFDVITSPTDSDENEKFIQDLIKEKGVNSKMIEELEKKKPKKKFSLFKKKKLIKKDLPIEELKEAKRKVHKIIDEEEVITPEIRELPKDEVEQTIEKIKEKQSNLFNKLKKKEKEKDIFCPECKHLMKSHKSGCDKCGCLMEMEDIRALQQVEDVKMAKQIKETQEVETPEVIQKQIKQIESMKKPKPEVQKPEQVQGGVEKPKLRLNPNKECTCEHFRKDHFDMTGFCAVKDCYCDEFRKYPHD